jgi:hypothetical protein
MSETPLYAVTIHLDNTVERIIENLTLYEAYQVVKPAPVDTYKQDSRWHVMMYNEVVQRIGGLPIGEPLLVAWEGKVYNMTSVSKYIKRMR